MIIFFFFRNPLSYTELIALTDTTDAMVTARKKKMDEFNSGNEILGKGKKVNGLTTYRPKSRVAWNVIKKGCI